MAFGFIKKTWKDRISEYPTRRTLTKEDGSTELVTVSRSEGTVSQEGDAYCADNMNDLEKRVDDALNEANSNLSEEDITNQFSAGSGCTIDYLKIIKKGNMIYATGRVIIGSASTETIILNVPSEYRPLLIKSGKYTGCSLGTAIGTYNTLFHGSVYAWNNTIYHKFSTAVTQCCFNVCWMI